MKGLPAPHHSQARGGTLQGGRSWPDNPVLVEVWRSGFLESVHRGAIVVLDPGGAVLAAAGAVDRAILHSVRNRCGQGRSGVSSVRDERAVV